MRGGRFWTGDRIALLRKLWAAGATAAAIASALGGGVSRAAVLGKIFRLRLGDGAGESAAAGRGPAVSPHSTDELARRRKNKRARSRQAPIKPPKMRRMSLLELTNESCRWFVEAGFKWAMEWALSHFQ